MDRAALKERSKASMSWAKPNVMLVSVVYLLITQTVTFFINFDSYAEMYSLFYDFGSIANFVGGYAWMPLLVFAVTLLLSVVEAGYSKYCLHVSRNEPASYGTLFDMLPRFGRVIWLNLLMALIIAVPLIVAMVLAYIHAVIGLIAVIVFVCIVIYLSLGFSQAIFLMVEYEELTASQCLRESMDLMKGRRGDYFVLGLSFILWNLLCVFVIPLIWVAPYMNVTYANYYNLITGRLTQTNQPPQPPEDQGGRGNIDPDMWK